MGEILFRDATEEPHAVGDLEAPRERPHRGEGGSLSRDEEDGVPDVSRGLDEVLDPLVRDDPRDEEDHRAIPRDRVGLPEGGWIHIRAEATVVNRVGDDEGVVSKHRAARHRVCPRRHNHPVRAPEGRRAETPAVEPLDERTEGRRKFRVAVIRDDERQPSLPRDDGRIVRGQRRWGVGVDEVRRKTPEDAFDPRRQRGAKQDRAGADPDDAHPVDDF